MKMSPQYLAGLIDGEGYLGLIPHEKRNSINTSYQCVMKLCLTGDTAEPVLRPIAEKYKGHLYKRRNIDSVDRKVFTLEVKSKPRMRVLLDDVQPYLIVKKEQAELMREFVNLPTIHPNYSSFSQELFDRRAEIAKELKSLTRRIPVATTERVDGGNPEATV